MFRHGTFARRLNVEICLEAGPTGDASLRYHLVVAGEPVPGEARAMYGAWVTGSNESFDAPGLPTTVEIQAPLHGAKSVCPWVHQVDSTGESKALRSEAEIEDGQGKRTFDLAASGGRIAVPAVGERIAIRIEISPVRV